MLAGHDAAGMDRLISDDDTAVYGHARGAMKRAAKPQNGAPGKYVGQAEVHPSIIRP